jgi:hypothetical protein
MGETAVCRHKERMFVHEPPADNFIQRGDRLERRVLCVQRGVDGGLWRFLACSSLGGDHPREAD